MRASLPDWQYLDLQKPSDASPIEKDPEARLHQLKRHVIFDEAQVIPALFPVLRSVVDASREENGRFALLGSASPTLTRRISESLAGRTSFLEMTPLRWHEIQPQAEKTSFKDLWFRGGFPKAFLAASESDAVQWAEAYTQTFIERDLTVLGIDVSAVLMRKLWTMLAHLQGALWNASRVAAALGVNYQTVNRYVDILEQTYLLRKLMPYQVNLGKRLVRSPKVYLRDTGLLHYFLGIHQSSVLDAHPARGSSWEGFIIEHIISAFQNRSVGSQPYFWRTSAGAEVDLLIDRGDRLIPFEVKLHTSPSTNDLRGLYACMEQLKIEKGYVLYSGSQTYSLGRGVTAIPTEKYLAQPELFLGL